MLQNMTAHFKQNGSWVWSSLNASNYAAPRFPLANHFYFSLLVCLEFRKLLCFLYSQETHRSCWVK